MPHIDPTIDKIISFYIDETNRSLSGLIEGFYIYGSVALGDYSLQLSDIDFIAVTNSRPDVSQIAALQKIHHGIRRKHPKPNLNGIYLTWNDLGKLPAEVPPFPYYSEGRMHSSGYYELNLVTWYELLHHGIRIAGPEINELNVQVDPDLFRTQMHENLNTYWANWIRKLEGLGMRSFLAIFNRSYIEWGVLGITRLFYTFRENRITSKVGAGMYALSVVPECWHSILNEAIDFRKGLPSRYRSGMRRKQDAIAYMKYILDECNSFVR